MIFEFSSLRLTFSLRLKSLYFFDFSRMMSGSLSVEDPFDLLKQHYKRNEKTNVGNAISNQNIDLPAYLGPDPAGEWVYH